MGVGLGTGDRGSTSGSGEWEGPAPHGVVRHGLLERPADGDGRPPPPIRFPLPRTALGSGEGSWNTLQRVSYVWLKNRWVAYPFQNNISALDKEDQIKCLTGCVEAKLSNAAAQGKPANFDEWIMRSMGPGIADLFMRPYNFKVWAVPTTMMQCEWLGERVATVDIERAISNVIHDREDAGWGPNAVFRFPTTGGTGGIWKGVAALLPAERQRYGPTQSVTGIDGEAKTVTFADGRRVAYDTLISTIPLDITLRWLGRPEQADGLQYSSTHVVGIGIRGACPHGLKCWLYFPEDDCPFYRTTVFSHYAEANCPAPGTALPTLCLADGSAPADGAAAPGPYWSLMFEISESQYKPVKQGDVTLGGTGGEWGWPTPAAGCAARAVLVGRGGERRGLCARPCGWMPRCACPGVHAYAMAMPSPTPNPLPPTQIHPLPPLLPCNLVPPPSPPQP